MKREYDICGSACSACEQDKPSDEVIWHINCYERNGYKKKGIGWMTGQQIEEQERRGRVFRTSSSSHCPPCMCKALGVESMEDLEEKWKNKEPEEIYESIFVSFRQFRKFLELQINI